MGIGSGRAGPGGGSGGVERRATSPSASCRRRRRGQPGAAAPRRWSALPAPAQAPARAQRPRRATGRHPHVREHRTVVHAQPPPGRRPGRPHRRRGRRPGAARRPRPRRCGPPPWAPWPGSAGRPGRRGRRPGRPDTRVRRRACRGGRRAARRGPGRVLADPDATVVEVAAWALGERAGAAGDGGRPAGTHRRRPRRPPVPGGGGGRPGRHRRRAGLAAILAATRDRPAVRRRAVMALAPFEGPEVDAALAAALDDRDWQVRQAAEDLASLTAEPLSGMCRGCDASAVAGRSWTSSALSAPMNRTLRDSKASRHLPAPRTTHSRGASTRCTGSSVSSARRWSRPRSMAPPPTRWMPWWMRSWASSGGAWPRHLITESTMARTCSSMASRISSGDRIAVLGRPVMRSGPGPRPSSRRRPARPSRWPA